jgi:hypothetical protein
MSNLLVQTNFSHGELSPKMIARSDLSLYLTGALKLRNLVVIPQGGARRRFGTRYINTVDAPADEYQIYRFELSADVHYLLLFTPLKLEIFRDDVLVNTTVTPYTGAMLSSRSLKFAQTENLLVITEPSDAPYELQNDGTDATWTFTQATVKFFPVHDFLKNYDAAVFTLAPQTIGTGRVLMSTIPVFNIGHVGGRFIGIGPTTATREGVATITGFTSTTEVTVEILSTFDASFATGVSGKNVFLAEVAWGGFNMRGWPRSCTFHEGRLALGGSSDLPQTLWMSVIEDFFNFNAGTGLASDAVNETLSTNQINEIKNLVSNRCLQVFTSSAEFADPQVDGDAITSSNIAILKQTNNGSENVEPVVLDNSTFYVKKGGRGVNSFTFTEDSNSYTSIPISTISEQLIVNPIDSAVLRGSSTDDADYLFLVNSDGTLAVYQTSQQENVSAWTLSNTDLRTEGKFKRVTNVDNEIYFIVERVINSVTVSYIEKLDFSLFMDSTVTDIFVSPETVITGLDHLEGEEVQVRGDGFVIPPTTVTNGEITLENAVSSIEVGLQYIPLLTTMPITVSTQDGPATYIPKRIVRIFIDYFESLGIFLEGKTNALVPYLKFGDMVLDQVQPPKSGIYEEGRVNGWAPRQTQTITQTDPIPMTILAIGYEVEI